jgi:hypothetical protein
MYRLNWKDGKPLIAVSLKLGQAMSLSVYVHPSRRGHCEGVKSRHSLSLDGSTGFMEAYVRVYMLIPTLGLKEAHSMSVVIAAPKSASSNSK